MNSVSFVIVYLLVDSVFFSFNPFFFLTLRDGKCVMPSLKVFSADKIDKGSHAHTVPTVITFPLISPIKKKILVMTQNPHNYLDTVFLVRMYRHGDTQPGLHALLSLIHPGGVGIASEKQHLLLHLKTI